jgi:hypothetical protein
MSGETYKGTYGSQKTPCEVFVYKKWYCVEGSCNVNRTHDDFFDGVNVEELQDFDIMTRREPINSLEELVDFVDN